MMYLRISIKKGTPFVRIRKVTDFGLEEVYPLDRISIKKISWDVLIAQCKDGEGFKYQNWDYDILTKEEAFLEMI